MICGEIRKLLFSIFWIIGLILSQYPRSFALLTTPKVPVKTNLSCLANFLAFKSSKMTNESLFSIAKAIADASLQHLILFQYFFDKLYFEPSQH